MNVNNKKMIRKTLLASAISCLAFNVGAVEVIDICPDEASRIAIHTQLRTMLQDAQQEDNGGFAFQMWATVVNRDGVVCAVAYSGDDRGDQWPGSRLISAQKANTANSYSLPEFALSTANLYQAAQPGGSLFGLQFSNPVNPSAGYAGNPSDYGTANDALVGQKIGGVNVFGGGLALYDSNGNILGAIGASGSSSCEDHNIAWRIRHAANMDYVPAGPSAANNDQIIYFGEPSSLAGNEHPDCGHGEKAVSGSLPGTQVAP